LYRAQTSVEIQGFDENFMNSRDVDPTAASGTDIYTLIDIMGSTALIERVVTRLKLDELVPPQAPWEPSFLDRMMGTLPPQPLTPVQRAARRARGGLEIETGRSRIVTISYLSPDPQAATAFVDAIADEFINYTLEIRWNSAQRTHDWLTEQLKEFKTQLESSENKLQAYARESALLFTSADGTVSEEKLRQLQAALSEAQADRISKQAQYELAVSSPLDALPMVLDSGSLNSYHMRLADLRRELAQLRSTFTPRHYKVQQVEAQIADLTLTVEKERGQIADRIRNEYDSALRREKLLQGDYRRQAGLVTDEAQKSIHYNLLNREVETNRQLYDGMLQRMKEARVMAAMQATNVRVVDPATPPSRPVSPRPVLGALAGLFAGMVFGAGFVLVREWGDRSLKSPGDTAFYLNLPELGAIPSAHRVPSSKSGLNRLPMASSIRKLLSGKNGASANGHNGVNGKNGKHGSLIAYRGDPSVELATWQQKTSLIAECYRAVLTSILFSSQQGEIPKVIVLSSPDPGEGKTSTVSNLGIALAEINRRVVIVDGDMRRPRLHRVFGLTGSKGLTDLLRSEKPIDQYPIESLVHPTEVPGLYVLPGGSGAVNISNLLYSPRMPELLERLRSEFDTVLIDSPPMLQIPDARVLGRMADGVVLVVRAGQTRRDSAVTASQRFAEDHTRVLGTILNHWDPRNSNAGYDGYHEYYKSASV
jgi:capsular exopolysaccharide synthesis family protein